MARFQYVGGGADAPKKTTVFGLEFRKGGDAVDVTDEAVAKKLRGNTTFKELKAGEKTAPEPYESENNENAGEAADISKPVNEKKGFGFGIKK